MSDEDGGFLSRWSRRKAEVKSGKPLPPEPVGSALPEASSVVAAPPVSIAEPVAVQAPAEPGPTLDDVAALAPGDEVSRFVARGVDETVKRAAVKKLFTDPHFNVMDGLDIYIDDYGKPDPIPMAMLRQMNQSKALGLFAAEEAAEEAAAAAARTSPATAAPLTPPAAEDASDGQAAAAVPHAPDEDPDLQLQPDDPAGPGGAEERARPDGV